MKIWAQLAQGRYKTGIPENCITRCKVVSPVVGPDEIRGSSFIS